MIERVPGQIIRKWMKEMGRVIGEYAFREICLKRDLTVERRGRRY